MSPKTCICTRLVVISFLWIVELVLLMMLPPLPTFSIVLVK